MQKTTLGRIAESLARRDGITIDAAIRIIARDNDLRIDGCEHARALIVTEHDDGSIEVVRSCEPARALIDEIHETMDRDGYSGAARESLPAMIAELYARFRDLPEDTQNEADEAIYQATDYLAL